MAHTTPTTPNSSNSHRLNLFLKHSLRTHPPTGSHSKKPHSTSSQQDDTHNPHSSSAYITTQTTKACTQLLHTYILITRAEPTTHHTTQILHTHQNMTPHPHKTTHFSTAHYLNRKSLATTHTPQFHHSTKTTDIHHQSNLL